uniref:Uncharacterized protein n=1 Tax=Opuntia streptacantha TaxID=393608 RepID=A0A7C9F6W7_OPUST
MMWRRGSWSLYSTCRATRPHGGPEFRPRWWPGQNGRTCKQPGRTPHTGPPLAGGSHRAGQVSPPSPGSRGTPATGSRGGSGGSTLAASTIATAGAGSSGGATSRRPPLGAKSGAG